MFTTDHGSTTHKIAGQNTLIEWTKNCNALNITASKGAFYVVVVADGYYAEVQNYFNGNPIGYRFFLKFDSNIEDVLPCTIDVTSAQGWEDYHVNMAHGPIMKWYAESTRMVAENLLKLGIMP